MKVIRRTGASYFDAGGSEDKMDTWELYKSQKNFSTLKGKTLVAIVGLEQGSERVTFVCADGSEFLMYHDQDCCEGVNIDDVFGDVEDLLGSEILVAEERTSDQNPPDYKGDTKYQDSFTWTFYELATNKGSVTIRWYGESNGYYSESVDFAQTKDASPQSK